MRTIILAAGVGKRLGDIAKSKPKCLLKVNNKTIIDTQLEVLNNCGINDITVVVGYKADLVKNALGSRVRYIENNIYNESNSSYSLWLAREILKDGWLHLNCDLLFSPDILKRVLRPKNANSVVVDFNLKPEDDQEKVCVKNGIIKKMNKAFPYEKAQGKTIGMARFSPEGAKIALAYLDNVINSGKKNRWFFSIIADVLNQVNFRAVPTENDFWAEIDTPEDLDNARKRI